MLKSILLTITILVSLTAFSQKDTKIITADSIITLPKSVAREVVKDIIKLDSCNAELYNIKKNYILLEKNNNFRDSIIHLSEDKIKLYHKKEVNYELMLLAKDEQKASLSGAINSLSGDLKKANRNLVKTKITAGAIIIFLAYLIIK